MFNIKAPTCHVKTINNDKQQEINALVLVSSNEFAASSGENINIYNFDHAHNFNLTMTLVGLPLFVFKLQMAGYIIPEEQENEILCGLYNKEELKYFFEGRDAELQKIKAVYAAWADTITNMVLEKSVKKTVGAQNSQIQDPTNPRINKYAANNKPSSNAGQGYNRTATIEDKKSPTVVDPKDKKNSTAAYPKDKKNPTLVDKKG